MVFMLIAFTRCSIGRSNELSLIVKHYAGGPGTTIIYLINKMAYKSRQTVI
jgi:hypothetical protein